MKTLSKISFDTKARILDIGCGDGVITKKIADMVEAGCVIQKTSWSAFLVLLGRILNKFLPSGKANS
ncbi:class I SAM-dependent methyltransferase [Legionella sp. 27cVA30]|nr:class I SAM-dependent methyltransferase [Legionella sp. 27cVA30]MCP0914903.1 class I SAM-dependent methyltransferase [Legionella sp. 27cVA30]